MRSHDIIWDDSVRYGIMIPYEGIRESIIDIRTWYDRGDTTEVLKSLFTATPLLSSLFPLHPLTSSSPSPSPSPSPSYWPFAFSSHHLTTDSCKQGSIEARKQESMRKSYRSPLWSLISAISHLSHHHPFVSFYATVTKLDGRICFDQIDPTCFNGKVYFGAYRKDESRWSD